MNAFETTSNIERIALERLRPFIWQRAFNGQYVVTSKGPLAKELQKTAGDILFNSDAETVWSVEIKAELENKHGNFFLETWSNRERFTPGWMITLRSDLLFYYFLKSDELYIIPFRKLQKWAFQQSRIYSFPERKQAKYDQQNDTWGRCAPIAVVSRELGIREPVFIERFMQQQEAA